MVQEERETRKELKIPAPVSDRDDFIQGIGIKEVMIILITLFVTIVFAAIFFVTSGNVVAALIIGAFLLGVTIITVKRDSINENLIDQIRNLYRYLKMQKIYEYVQYDIYGGYDQLSEGKENAD